MKKLDTSQIFQVKYVPMYPILSKWDIMYNIFIAILMECILISVSFLYVTLQWGNQYFLLDNWLHVLMRLSLADLP